MAHGALNAQFEFIEGWSPLERLELEKAEQKVFQDVKAYCCLVRSIVKDPPSDLEEGIAMLIKMRGGAYEDLNQIQHEHAVLLAAKWLLSEHPEFTGADLSWNPRQTGDGTEPDLRIESGGHIAVSAEVTTSPNPVGSIDRRMASTLEKLQGMEGRKFYFVVADAMRVRADTKVRKAGYRIQVVQLAR